jgi:hypothetical protein
MWPPLVAASRLSRRLCSRWKKRPKVRLPAEVPTHYARGGFSRPSGPRHVLLDHLIEKIDVPRG